MRRESEAASEALMAHVLGLGASGVLEKKKKYTKKL